MTDPGKIFDGLLVLRYREGTKNAINVLVGKYHNKLCKHSYGYTKDIDASRDIVQDCWTKILGKLDSLQDPNLFSSWAFRIVTRKSLDYVNRRKRELGKLQEFQNLKPFDEIKEGNQQDEIEKLLGAIKNLTCDQQQVLRLFYTENYSLHEISEILNIAVGTVKSRLFHAREQLKTIIKK